MPKKKSSESLEERLAGANREVEAAYKNLSEICQKYPECSNAFVAYESATKARTELLQTSLEEARRDMDALESSSVTTTVVAPGIQFITPKTNGGETVH